MATVKVKFRASSVPTKEGTLFYRVIHGRIARQVGSGCKLYPHEWNAADSSIVFPADVGESRRYYLASSEKALHEDIGRLKSIISHLERSGRNYTAEDVMERFLSSSDSGGFVSFARDVIRRLEHAGKSPTAERYTTVINSFGRFLGGNDMPLNEFDSGLMIRYEDFLKSMGVCPNTTSYYMRGLRAVYNRAVEKGLTVQRNPFRHVYTGIDKTVKRAVPLDIIRRIRNSDLALCPATDFARDVFMFSFYTRGMSFIDMAYLKKKDLLGDTLSYRRRKTGQRMSVKWERPMQAIIDKYDTSGTPYLLPIITDMNADRRQQYRNAAHRINDKLKKLGRRLGMDIPLTTYVARHGWASIAKSRNIPLPTISEAMGHDSEKTTRIYLASLDTSAVDKANDRILKAL